VGDGGDQPQAKRVQRHEPMDVEGAEGSIEHGEPRAAAGPAEPQESKKTVQTDIRRYFS